MLLSNSSVYYISSMHEPYEGDNEFLTALRWGGSWIIRKLMLTIASDEAKKKDRDTIPDMTRMKDDKGE